MLRRMPWIRPFSSVLTAAERLLDRGLCVLGAILFSQVPEFIQQYLQRLGGRLDEARLQLYQLRRVAEHSGLSLDQLAARTGADPDPAVARLGSVLGEAVDRVRLLEAADAAIRGAAAWARPFAFARHFDPSTARSTWAIFKPAVPTTVEGASYALAGMLLMLALYHIGIKHACRRGMRAWRNRRGPRPEPATG
jgi:hypothetical protein